MILLKKLLNPVYTPGLVLLLLFFIFCGCGKKRPVRKKLPDNLSGFQSLEDGYRLNMPDSSLMPFYCNDTSVFLNGIRQNMWVITLPETDDDSLALNIVRVWEPMKNVLWAELIMEKKKGAVIDLREGGNRVNKKEMFIINNLNAGHPLFLIFLYDQHTIFRRDFFINELKEVPGINVTSSGKSNSTGIQDCFANNKPTIE